MTKLYEAAASLPTAVWDLTTFLSNAKNSIQGWGGSLLMLLGAVALVWGGVLLIKKLMASPQSAGQQSGWGTIALLILVGGGFLTGGWQLIKTIGGGGKKTILDLGNGNGGTVIVDTVNHFLTSGLF